MRRRLRRTEPRVTAANHATPVRVDATRADRWRVTLRRHHVLPVNSALLRAWDGKPPRVER